MTVRAARDKPTAPDTLKLPPNIPGPVTINTLGMCIVEGFTITAHCNGRGCYNSKRLNLVTLARKLGVDHSCMADKLTPHLFCSACRAAGRTRTSFDLSLSPPCDALSAWPRRKAT